LRLIAWGGAQTRLPRFGARAVADALSLQARGGGIDGIHLGDAVLSPLGLVLKRALRVPVTVSAHGLDVTYGSAPYQAIVPRALGGLDAVICNSRATREACAARGVPPGKCRVIPCGVAPGRRLAVPDDEQREVARAAVARRFGGVGGGPVILSVGRLVRRKGIAWFVESVVPRLRARVPGLTVLVVGDGAERRRIERAIERSSVTGTVRVPGLLSDDDLRLAYAAADCLVMPNLPVPSDPEGFGIAALDASVAGLWVYGSRVDGIPEAVLDGINGSLLPAEDAATWTDTLAEALRDPLALRRRGGQGREASLSRFGWPAVADRYVGVFATVGMLG
jgi:glycosyltransferase involved in cell wall biosynthesis